MKKPRARKPDPWTEPHVCSWTKEGPTRVQFHLDPTSPQLAELRFRRGKFGATVFLDGDDLMGLVEQMLAGLLAHRLAAAAGSP